MIRPVWFLTGVGAGIYVMVKARRAVEVFTPEGWHDRLAGLQRERLLIGPDGARALPAGTAPNDERL